MTNAECEIVAECATQLSEIVGRFSDPASLSDDMFWRVARDIVKVYGALSVLPLEVEA